MDGVLEELPEVEGITDNVCVHGTDEEEHYMNRRPLMERKNAFSPSGQTSVTYANQKLFSLGNTYFRETRMISKDSSE